MRLTRTFFNGQPNHYPPDIMRSSDFENSDGPGAAMVFVIRHAERLDRADPSWSSKALRPQDTPLSETGKYQAKRLGKWLYGRLPTRAPLAIFCSPFIRCVQTADAIASELEGLQRSGLHTASATKICIEPGLMEDMTFMAHLRQHEPYVWSFFVCYIIVLIYLRYCLLCLLLLLILVSACPNLQVVPKSCRLSVRVASH